MELNEEMVLPSSAEKGLTAMMDQLHMIKDIINDYAIKREDNEVERERVYRLLTELNLIKKLVVEKYNEFQILDLDVLFKFTPQLARASDFKDYEVITGQTPSVQKIIDLNSDESLNAKTNSFRTNFKVSWNNDFCEHLYEFLVTNNFINNSSKKESLVKLFMLEAIPSNERIIWKDKMLGKPTLKILAMLCYRLITSISQKKHGRIPFNELIPQYFKPKAGEFNRASLKTVISILNKEKERDISNEREQLLSNYLQTNYSIYNR